MSDETKSWWDAAGELLKSLLKHLFGSDEEDMEEEEQEDED